MTFLTYPLLTCFCFTTIGWILSTEYAFEIDFNFITSLFPSQVLLSYCIFFLIKKLFFEFNFTAAVMCCS